MKNKHFSLLFLFILGASSLLAQLNGNISDKAGEPLSFATIYVKNTTIGTTSNIDGDYALNLSPGNYEIIFQYVGYEQKLEKITITDVALNLDVQLDQQSVGLTEVIVKSDGEDPAYAIIRKAMGKRKYYLNQVEEFSCNVYMKGNQRVADVPEKIMGMEVGDMGGILDTTGSGIVYLSESVSKVYFNAPDDYKEEMISSKVSGDDNGFSFNQASALDFNFYKNTYDDLGRNIVSPIGNNAFNYYRYRLEGAFVDESGQMVNKIKVIRKRDTDPSLSGYIYINEDLWNIHSVDMWANGEAFAAPVLDSIFIKQVNVPVGDSDVWKVFSSNVSFSLKIFGITFDGQFTGVFTDYDLNPGIEKKFFDNQILVVQEGSNEKDSTYWETIRPIPLTLDEELDYVKKDSLQVVWKSKEFLDSMDQESNKFKFINLLAGYTYSNSYKKWFLSFGSPLTTISYNTVQGFYPLLNTTFEKNFDDDGNKYLRFNTTALYGFSDKQFRGKAGFEYNLNKTKYTNIGFEGGRMASQFNGEEPISTLINSYMSVVYRRNYGKFYDKTYARFKASSEIANGIRVNGFLEYADRQPLVNQSDYSFFYRDTRIYSSNDPLNPTVYEVPSFQNHQALTLGLDIRIRFKQEYLSYPDRKFIVGSKYPDLLIQYRRGLPILGGDSNYDFISLAIRDDIRLGMAGTSSFNLEGGMFLSDKSVPFIDQHHFNGRLTSYYTMDNVLDQFRMLDYYSNSTTLPYAKLQWEHNFEGVILGKVPGIRKLQWELIAGSNLLYSDPTQMYSEVMIGFDKIGFGIFKIFRVDFVTQFQQGRKKPNFRMMIGVDL